MSDSPIKATLKSGTGYDAPWLTVDAENPAELEQRLRGIIDSKVLETVHEAASLFQSVGSAAPLTQAAPQQQAPAQQVPPQNQGWGQSQQAAPQQAGGQSQYGNQLHPEGKQCTACGNVLEYGKTRTGKGQWKCNQYRWNNGNPNEHTLEWAN